MNLYAFGGTTHGKKGGALKAVLDDDLEVIPNGSGVRVRLKPTVQEAWAAATKQAAAQRDDAQARVSALTSENNDLAIRLESRRENSLVALVLGAVFGALGFWLAAKGMGWMR